MARRRKVHKMTSARRAALRKAQIASARKRRRRRGAAVAVAGVGVGVAMGLSAPRGYRRVRALYNSRNVIVPAKYQRALPPGRSRPPTAAQQARARRRQEKIKIARSGVTPHLRGKGIFKVAPSGRTVRVTRHRPEYDAMRRSQYQRRPRQKYGPRTL